MELRSLLLVSFVALVILFLQVQPNSQQRSGNPSFDVDTTNILLRNRFPDFVLFRRSPKTGSSSMAPALATALRQWHYEPISPVEKAIQYGVLHWTRIKNPQQRFLFLYHNDFSRADLPEKNVLIVDTIRDGFSQITSQCRFAKRAKTCGKDMIDCLKGEMLLNVTKYRWGKLEQETSENYIDIPLSSAHPALSTTALRSVFPDIELDVQRYNYKRTTCNRTEELEKVYNMYGKELDRQVENLAIRLLIVSGYKVRLRNIENISVWKFLDEAERHERTKYNFKQRIESYDYNEEVKALRDDWKNSWEIKYGEVKWRNRSRKNG